MKKYTFGLGFLLLIYIVYLVQDTLIIFAYFIGSIIIIGLTVGFFIGLWFVFEKMLMIRASRIEQQKKSQVMVINNNGGTWIRDTNDKAGYMALHLQQQIFNTNNAIPSVPSAIEAQAWQIVNGPKTKMITGKADDIIDIVPSKSLPPIVDRLQKSHQILISGVTGAGKTTLCKHLLTYLITQGYSIIPCDIHSPGKVLGFDVVGSGRRFQDIFNALEVLVDTMDKRIKHPNFGKNVYNPKPIAMYIDELTTLVKEAKKVNFDLADALETLLVEGRKANIKMILSIHSLDVKTLGLTAGIRGNNTMVQLLGGEGSPYQCYVVPPLASIRSKKNWIEHQVPGPFIGNLEQQRFVTKLPDARTIKIKNLGKQGFKPTPIANYMNGGKRANGRQIAEVKRILKNTT